MVEAKGDAVGSYRDLVERLRTLVDAHVPLSAPVGVLSRGDPQLLQLGGRTAWHVPRYDDGRYAGYHPADGPAAVAAVDAVRAAGAEFLVVPATSSWWLDHYDGLREHLAAWGSPVVDEPGIVSVHRLSDSAEPPGGPADEQRRIAADLGEIASLLLPTGADVLLVARPDAPPLSLDGVRLDVTAPEAVVPSGLARKGGYLLVPATLYPWLADRADVRAALEGSARLVTWQAHVGAIYELGVVSTGARTP